MADNDYVRKLREAQESAEQLQARLGDKVEVYVRQAYPKVYIEVRPVPKPQ